MTILDIIIIIYNLKKANQEREEKQIMKANKLQTI